MPVPLREYDCKGEALGEPNRELGGDTRDLPEYFSTISEPPEIVKWSRRNVASSTKPLGPYGGKGGGYLSSNVRAVE